MMPGQSICFEAGITMAALGENPDKVCAVCFLQMLSGERREDEAGWVCANLQGQGGNELGTC